MTAVTTAPKLRVDRSPRRALQRFDADRLGWLDQAAAAGPVAGLQMGFLTTWVVTDPEIARTMLVTESGSWARPSTLLASIRTGIGENLFTQSEKHWARLQPAVAPSFRKKALEARLAGLAPRLLGLANVNDQVIPPGGVLNLLQGLHRDTGVRVEELELGVHEHPFSCDSYGARDRRFVAEFLDEERYGAPFARFIESTRAMLRP